MKRREFLALLGGATAWPLRARAQQSNIPVIGFLSSGTVPRVEVFRTSLGEFGYVDGKTVAFEHRAPVVIIAASRSWPGRRRSNNRAAAHIRFAAVHESGKGPKLKSRIFRTSVHPSIADIRPRLRFSGGGLAGWRKIVAKSPMRLHA
jgi:hypothetical protein